MKRIAALAGLLVAVSATPTFAAPQGGRSVWLDQRIAWHAQRHGVPERLVHRIVVRESRYQPHLVSKGNYGLMQIKPATARGMGYAGSPAGLLDPEVNLTYAVPYLANAWRLANGSEDRAVALYAGGYYYVAKRRGMLGQMRTAHSAGSGGAETGSRAAEIARGGRRGRAAPAAAVEPALTAPAGAESAPAEAAPAPALDPARN
ncbi:MAG: lytic transglycosylase domain-containing protein [Rhizobiales bacterium]|nr:lytic transglycosylase domain-containing protein [Hyphomicrobiales bacterium]